jgi:3-oxoacyl-[acyl-carrier protein] reductase
MFVTARRGSLESTVALVTGGAQGLGAATAVALAARGWSVAVADIDAEGARRTVTSCEPVAQIAAAPASAFSIAVDLATGDGPRRVVDETLRRFGRLDVLINCAAYAPVESFFDMTAKCWEAALLINVRAVALSMSAAGRAMIQQRSGHIVNVTSAAARMAPPNFAAYAATKAAVDALTRAGAVALGPHGVRVNGFSPGMMDTPMQESIEAHLARLEDRPDVATFKAERTARVPMKRRTSPEEMAQSLVWLAIDSPRYMTAERLNVSGGLDKD